jgi:hypothetical protein
MFCLSGKQLIKYLLGDYSYSELTATRGGCFLRLSLCARGFVKHCLLCITESGFVTSVLRLLKRLGVNQYSFIYVESGSSVGKAAAYWLDGLSLIPGRRKIFLFSTTSRPALGPTQPHIQWVLKALSLRRKRQGREADPLTFSFFLTPVTNASHSTVSFFTSF